MPFPTHTRQRELILSPMVFSSRPVLEAIARKNQPCSALPLAFSPLSPSMPLVGRHSFLALLPPAPPCPPRPDIIGCAARGDVHTNHALSDPRDHTCKTHRQQSRLPAPLSPPGISLSCNVPPDTRTYFIVARDVMLWVPHWSVASGKEERLESRVAPRKYSSCGWWGRWSLAR